jgi:hypothetical protein
MTHEELNRSKIHPVFKKMGSETVPKHVDTSLLADSGLCFGFVEDSPDSGFTDGTAFVFSEEKPGLGVILLPIVLQMEQEVFRKNGIAVFLAFALFNFDHHPAAVDVGNFKMSQLVDP